MGWYVHICGVVVQCREGLAHQWSAGTSVGRGMSIGAYPWGGGVSIGPFLVDVWHGVAFAWGEVNQTEACVEAEPRPTPQE